MDLFSCSLEQDDQDLEGRRLSHQPLVIDAGELVWALAFGSSTCHHGDIGRQETRADGTVRYHYLVAKDLMLATGLARGRIRTWDVKTGWSHFGLDQESSPSPKKTNEDCNLCKVGLQGI